MYSLFKFYLHQNCEELRHSEWFKCLIKTLYKICNKNICQEAWNCSVRLDTLLTPCSNRSAESSVKTSHSEGYASSNVIVLIVTVVFLFPLFHALNKNDQRGCASSQFEENNSYSYPENGSYTFFFSKFHNFPDSNFQTVESVDFFNLNGSYSIIFSIIFGI